MTHLILFIAPRCEPSDNMRIVLEQQEIEFKLIDLEATPELGIPYDIRATPTLVATFESGREIRRKIGHLDYESLGAFLNSLP